MSEAAKVKKAPTELEKMMQRRQEDYTARALLKLYQSHMAASKRAQLVQMVVCHAVNQKLKQIYWGQLSLVKASQ